MNEHQNDIELIERFFRQRLNDDELLAFENRVRQEPEFSKEVIHMRDIFYGVKWTARKDLKAELQEIQTTALSEGTEPYKPGGLKGFKWLKWFTGLVITACIVGIAYTYFDKGTIEHFKSYFYSKDSVLVYDTPISASPLPADSSAPIILKVPSDERYKNMQADFKLQVKDPKTFKIKKIGITENGLYTYEIQADGKTEIVSSTSAELVNELTKMRREAISDTIYWEKANPVEGIDF